MSERMRISRKKETAGPSTSIQNDSLQRSLVAPEETRDEVPSIVQDVLSSAGQPLDAATRTFMEPRFGHDFSQVRVHTDERAVESAQAVNALAYTVGQEVVFGQGQYVPESSDGKRLLAHELTHVVQQSSMSSGGQLAVGSPGDSYEQEADSVSDAIGTGGAIQPGAEPIRLQRTLGDGHDLTSSRFAGDPVLEACYDDERYLRAGERGTVGDHGPAVEKIQQALVDLGFPLPKFGVDGKFGPETEAAVKAFQRSSGAVDDGIIGPITMGLLDVKAPRSAGNKPEIEATDEALGQKVKEDMNALNLSPDFGVWYAEVYKDKVVNKDKRPDLWNDDYWKGYADPAYFERIAPMDWRLLPGKSASAALKSWFKGLTIAECNSSLVAIEIDALRAAIGDEKFDEHFGSTNKVIPEADRLRIKSGTAGTPVEKFMTQTDAAKTGDAGTIGARPVKVGEWYYFYNHPKYLLKHPGGAWQGENAVCMEEEPGRQTWSGFGASNVTEQEMLNTMVAAYNGERTDRDREVLQQAYGDSLPDIYIEKYPDGEFPRTITVENILNDPEYEIYGTKRKGGFLLEAGKKLDAAKVQALRNE